MIRSFSDKSRPEMQTIFRNARPTTFTVIPNSLINDERLSDSLMALLIFLLSKPLDWRVSIASLEACGRFGGHSKICRTTRALRDIGYMRMERHADGTTEWLVTDSPGQYADHQPHAQNRNEADNPHAQKPHSQKPHSQNEHGIQNKESLQSTEDLQSTDPLKPPKDEPVEPDLTAKPKHGAKRRISPDDYTEDFLVFRSLYPARTGNNSAPAAFRAWNARIKEGITPEEMIAQAMAYAAHCDRERKTGTAYVMMSSTFLNSDHNFRQHWRPKQVRQALYDEFDDRPF